MQKRDSPIFINEIGESIIRQDLLFMRAAFFENMKKEI
jgi:hypothetical protein